MLDYSLPLAKRTRLRLQEGYKEYHMKKKKEEERIKNTTAESASSTRHVEAKGNNQSQESGSSSRLINFRFNCNVDSKFEAESCSDSYDDNDGDDVDGDGDDADVDDNDNDDDEEEETDDGSSVELVEGGIESVGQASEGVESGDIEWIDLTGFEETEAVKKESDELDEVCLGGKGRRAELGVKRKKAFGLDILVDVDDKKCDHLNVRSKRNSMAKRTRSHFDSESVKKKMEFGTIRRPIFVDEELESLPNLDCSQGDGGHSVGKTRSNGKIGPKEGTYNDKKELKQQTKRQRKHAPKNHDVLKILADSLLEDGVMPVEDEAPKEESQLDIEIGIPLKFTFGVEEPILSEKSEGEKEIDELFVEMEFALRSSEIGSGSSVDSTMIEDDGNAPPQGKLDMDSLCRQGKHQLKLDEEIGLVCRFCSHVAVEIRYIVPSFCTDRGVSERRYCDREDKSLFDELENQDFGFNSQYGNNLHDYSEGTVWDLVPDVRRSLYHHQREGFEFLWSNIAGGIFLDKLQDPSCNQGGCGCIISHAPGTGKTRLTIVFLHSYMKLYPACKPVIVAPSSMLLTWEEEFKKWKVDLPLHILNNDDLSGKENTVAVGLLNRVKEPRQIRLAKLFSWKNGKSVLGISYRLFEQLAGQQRKKAHQNYEDEKVRTLLLETPGLFIFDEGHTPRNDHSLMWKALSRIKTERRIILSGTPFQNNFKELYNTLCLVRPSFADKISSTYGRRLDKKCGRKKSEAKEKWTSLTGSISKVCGPQLEPGRIEELRAMIAPFVHIHKGNILQQTLPGLRHSVVVLQPEPVQKSLLDVVQGRKNVIMTDYFVSLVSVHPSLLPETFGKESFVDRDKLEKLRSKPEAGVKTRFLMELLRLSEAVNEKVLVFGQYLEPLICLRDQLKSQFNWTEGNEVLYMDGSCDAKQRQSSINFFNDPTSEVRVMLASIKACSEGINLVGASRVVLLDVAWNPSVERQAISRAYRIGQKKIVYIYHLITSGTMEEEKFCRQAKKDRLSELVFSSPSNTINEQENISVVWEDKILEELVQHERLKCMFTKIIYQPKDSDLIETFGLVKPQ